MATRAPDLGRLEEVIARLSDRLDTLEDTMQGAVTLYIHTFAPEPHRLKAPIPVTIQRRPDGFLASFVDANVNASGDTQQEAFANVRELILDVFDSLAELPESRLGPGPKRQLAVLREFIDVAPDHERAR